MAYIRLTTAEKDLLETVARQPAEAPLAAPWLPRRKVEDAYRILDYTMQRVEPPVGSPLGETSSGVASSRSETNRPLISFRMTYSINKTDMRVARRSGYSPVQENLTMMRSAMEHSILKLVFQGTTGDDLPDISGMFDVGEDTDAALDDNYWATATEPVAHAQAGYDDLIANFYYPPFTWILSWNLMSGLQALNNAANPRTHGEIIRAGYVTGGVYAYRNGTSAYGAGGYTIYPLQAAANDDGVWAMFAPKNGAGEDNFYLAEVTNGIEVRVADTTDENNRYVYEMEWRGTPVFRGATTGSAGSAPYIVFEPDVDLAS